MINLFAVIDWMLALPKPLEQQVWQDSDEVNREPTHVEYQGYEAFIDIATGEVTKGRLPKRAASMVRDWCLKHQQELMDNWGESPAV